MRGPKRKMFCFGVFCLSLFAQTFLWAGGGLDKNGYCYVNEAKIAETYPAFSLTDSRQVSIAQEYQQTTSPLRGQREGLAQKLVVYQAKLQAGATLTAAEQKAADGILGEIRTLDTHLAPVEAAANARILAVQTEARLTYINACRIVRKARGAAAILTLPANVLVLDEVLDCTEDVLVEMRKNLAPGVAAAGTSTPAQISPTGTTPTPAVNAPVKK